MNIYDQLGWYYAEINRDSALSYFEKELPISRKLKLRLYEADALNGIGWTLEQLGNYPKSLESYLEGSKNCQGCSQRKECMESNTKCMEHIQKPGP